MLGWLSKAFEQMCSFCVIINFGFLAQIIEIRKKVDLLSKNSGN